MTFINHLGSFIEHKRSSLTWHYRMADPEFGAFQAKECQNHLENAVLSKLPVEILVGKKNLEVRPTIVNKGEIVKRLLGQHPETEFVMCAGDDKTDEDMFRALAGVSNTQQNQTIQNGGGHSSRRSSSASAAVEPYNYELVAETAAKIAQATLAHSLEHHSPMASHAYVPHKEMIIVSEAETHLTPTSAITNVVPAHLQSPSLTSTGASTPVSEMSGMTASSMSTSATVSATHGPNCAGKAQPFSITIGHALKKTLANWHVTSPEELIRVLGILAGTDQF